MVSHQGIRTFASQHRRFVFLLVAVSLFLGTVALLLGMVGPARFVAAYKVQAQHVHTQAGTVELDGAIFTSTLGYGTSGHDIIGITCTTGTGDNRLMLLSVYWQCVSNVRSITGVTFTTNSGIAYPLTLVGMVENYAGFGRRNAIYKLVGPPLSASGYVTVTFSGYVQYGTVAGVANFKGVDQSNPLGTYVSSIYSDTVSTTVTDTTKTLTVTTTANDLVYDSVALYSAAPVAYLTATLGQTELWNVRYAPTDIRVRGVASTKLADSTTTLMSWTAAGGPTGNRSWALSAVPIKPAAVGPTYDLTVTVDPGGSGTTNPTGTHTYAENTVVTVTAAANTGYQFNHWSGACSGSGSCVVTMNANKAVTATFTAIPQYTLTANNDGHGSVTLNPPGGTYYSSTTVTLTVTPADCYVFNNWSGANAGDIVNTGGVYTIVMNGNKTVQANFSVLPQYTLTANNDGHGSVTLNPSGGTYCTGTTVTLTPVGNTGYVFSSWSGANAGDIVNTSGVYTIVMNGNKTVQANFVVGTCTTVNLVVSADTLINSYSSGVTWNFGAMEWVHVSNWESSNTCSRGGLFQWDVSSIPSNATVSSASLTLNVITAPTDSKIYNLYNMKQAWVEGTGKGSATGDGATWQTYDGTNRWAQDGASGTATITSTDRQNTNLWGATASSFATTGIKTENLNASGVAVVQGWVNGSIDNLGLTMQNYTPNDTGTDKTSFASKENTQGAAGATLNVTYCYYTATTCYSLTLGHTGNGTTPTASPTNSTGCPAGQYVAGESISLSGATPSTGWGIASWTGTISDTSKANTNSVTMPASAHAAGVNYLRLLGDVNKDGKVNSTDALIVLSADAAISTTQFCPMNYGDVNGDGLVNSTDALIILSYDAAMSVPFPLGQPRPEPVLSTQPPGCGS